MTLHYTAGNNINAQGTYTPAAAGFNLADVSSVDELNALPANVKGMVYLDQGDGVTQSFIDALKPYAGNSKVYAFYLKDEPDPTGQYNTLVTAANLKAESDYIHANFPGAKTFITMMNMGASENPTFANTYNPANTHIDLFGIDPYPVRSDMSTVDYSMIDKAVAAAESAGISVDHIVPVFQTFGGGNWADDSGGHYVMPTAAQEQTMLAHWAAAVPNPAFDYAYAWGSQNSDTALESSSALQSVFLQHNTGTSTTAGGTGGASGSTTGSATGSSGGSTTTPGRLVARPPARAAPVPPRAAVARLRARPAAVRLDGSTSTTTDGTHHQHHQHHQHHHLDFSQLTTDAAVTSSPAVATSTMPTAAATASGATDTTTDVGTLI